MKRMICVAFVWRAYHPLTDERWRADTLSIKVAIKNYVNRMLDNVQIVVSHWIKLLSFLAKFAIVI